MRGAAKSLIRLLEPALSAALILAAAWACFAVVLGDHSPAMVVGMSGTCAACAAIMSGLASEKRAPLFAAAAAGVGPALGFATLRAFSTPLMGEAVGSTIGTRGEAIEAFLVGGGLTVICAAMAALATRRSSAGRVGRVTVAILTWMPAVVIPAALVLTAAEGGGPDPAAYALTQPVLAHMEPERSGGLMVVDEIERTDGTTLVRVCEQDPWCYTLLRRGNHITSRPGQVARDAVVHLRYDPNHLLYLVESDGALVATAQADTLASYTVLFPSHVRRSLSPPFGYQLLAALGIAGVLGIALLRRRLTRRASLIRGAQAGVCFGEGWALLADGTTLRVPGDLARGPILASWEAHPDGRALTILRGLRDDMSAALSRQREQLDALQQAMVWTLGTPLVMATALI